ncbi:hypothetical protein K8B33_07655 [Alcanivorax sp. JB21]|nr:hypothetical protein [Alcanivorax limicola]
MIVLPIPSSLGRLPCCITTLPPGGSIFIARQFDATADRRRGTCRIINDIDCDLDILGECNRRYRQKQ